MLEKPETDTKLCSESEQKTKIIDYISYVGVYVDEVIRASGLDASAVSLELLELEMGGKITRQPGNKVARIK
jgi:DNA processing protein